MQWEELKLKKLTQPQKHVCKNWCYYNYPILVMKWRDVCKLHLVIDSRVNCSSSYNAKPCTHSSLYHKKISCCTLYTVKYDQELNSIELTFNDEGGDAAMPPKSLILDPWCLLGWCQVCKRRILPLSVWVSVLGVHLLILRTLLVHLNFIGVGYSLFFVFLIVVSHFSLFHICILPIKRTCSSCVFINLFGLVLEA